MAAGKKTKLAIAEHAACRVLKLLRPRCSRIVVAGSIRRRVTEVGDIEFVCIPKFTHGADPSSAQASLFQVQAQVSRNPVHEAITDNPLELKPVAAGSLCAEVDPHWESKLYTKIGKEFKYFKLWMPSPGIHVDVWMVSPEAWGYSVVSRTGSAEFSKGLVKYWTKLTGGHVYKTRLHKKAGAGEPHVVIHPSTGVRLAEPISTPEESDVFEALNMQTPPPQERQCFAKCLARNRLMR